MLPHLGVHGGEHHDRAVGGEQGVGEQVVGQAVGGLGQEVGRGRGHDHHVGLLTDAHVGHFVDTLEEVVGHRPAGQRRPGGRTDELECRCRGHNRDRRVQRLDPAQHLSGFVGGDAATYSEDNLGSQTAVSSCVTVVVSNSPSLISRSAMDSGFSCW